MEFRRLLAGLVLLLAALFILGGCQDFFSGLANPPIAAPKKTVRVSYLVPSDKTEVAAYTLAIENGIKDFQVWLLNQLASGKTFLLEDPVVEVLQTPHPMSWYGTNNPGPQVDSAYWFWQNAVNDGIALAGATFGDPDHRWVFYIDADNLCGQRGGAGGNGIAAMPANDLRGLSGYVVEKHHKTCPDDPDSFGQFGVSRWIGGLGHELLHTLGIPHPPGCEDQNPQTYCPADALMWAGYANYPNTYLLPEEKAALDQNPFIVNFSPLGR